MKTQYLTVRIVLRINTLLFFTALLLFVILFEGKYQLNIYEISTFEAGTAILNNRLEISSVKL